MQIIINAWTKSTSPGFFASHFRNVLQSIKSYPPIHVSEANGLAAETSLHQVTIFPSILGPGQADDQQTTRSFWTQKWTKHLLSVTPSFHREIEPTFLIFPLECGHYITPTFPLICRFRGGKSRSYLDQMWDIRRFPARGGKLRCDTTKS